MAARAGAGSRSERRPSAACANGIVTAPSRSRLPFAFSAAAVLLGAPVPDAQGPGLEKITHLIVIYQENWSFDGLYGRFPGADGLANAGETVRQTTKDGTPYTALPPPLDTSRKPPGVD